MNLSNDTEHGYGNSMPSIDEGWWQSVLAEEMRQYHAPLKPTLAPQHQAAIQLDANPARQAEDLARSPVSNHSSPSRLTTPASSERRAEIFQSLQLGARLKGTVSSITDFGAFIDLGGLEGLIHISELSWGRVSHPNQIVRLGEQLEVQVLEISQERNRVALSLKRTLPNPWEQAEVEFGIDTIQFAVVSSVLSYGAFARLKPGIEGLIHVSKMPLGAGQTPHDLLTEGQQVQVRVLYIDPTHQRMGLRLQTEH
ncbi:MAG TPA: S1 RNA-binding domain-containing protein [Anaerolineales bacterium]|nr:S1 RNA-binding domain-containing protein [Anaerolineales bacterium]